MQTYAARVNELAKQEHELIIHSLAHEDNAGNFDRHVLVIEKWLRNYSAGFFIRDLEEIIQILSVLRSRMETHPQMFQSVLTTTLVVAGKPLFECKANERLRTVSINLMKRFYKSLSDFWSLSTCDTKTRQDIALLFRTVSNGGVDPRILKVDVRHWQPDGEKTQVTDRSFVHMLLRDGGAVEMISREFMETVSALLGDANAKEEARLIKEQADREAAAIRERQGLPTPNSQRGPGDDSDSSDDEAPSQPPGGMEGAPAAANQGPETQDDQGDLQLTARLLFLLVTELAAESAETAAHLCGLGFCAGLIDTLHCALQADLRDERVGVCVSILWTALEARLDLPRRFVYMETFNISPFVFFFCPLPHSTA